MNTCIQKTLQEDPENRGRQYLDCVWLNKFSICILVCDFLLSQCYSITPVQWANVILNRFCHRHPVVFDCWKQNRCLSFSLTDLFPQPTPYSQTDFFHDPVTFVLFLFHSKVTLLKFKELHQQRPNERSVNQIRLKQSTTCLLPSICNISSLY